MANFDTSDGTAVSLPSMVITERPICYSEDSCAANFAPNLQDLTDLSLLVATHFGVSGKIRAVNPGAIQGLYNAQVLSSAPTDDGTAVLVEAATLANGGIDLRLVPKSGAQPRPSELKYAAYVCFFDKDGQPEDVDKLDGRYRPTKIAFLGQDELLLLLFDRVNDRAVMAVMKEDGRIVQFLDPQRLLPGSSALVKSSGFKVSGNPPELMKQIAAEGSLSRWQLGYAAKQLLIMQPGTNPVVWSISPGGEIRKVMLEMPAGTEADSILSSDGPWLIRSFVLPNPSETQLLLQFDPQTGKVVRRIDTEGAPPSTMLFAERGHYYAFWWDKNRQAKIVESR